MSSVDTQDTEAQDQPGSLRSELVSYQDFALSLPLGVFQRRASFSRRGSFSRNISGHLGAILGKSSRQLVADNELDARRIALTRGTSVFSFENQVPRSVSLALTTTLELLSL